jgi:hypothetical protein
MLHGHEIRSIMGHGRSGDELESFLRPKRYAAGFPTTHTLHHPSKTMKKQEALVRIPNQRSQCIWLPALLAALALFVSATPARAQYDQIITPNQFLFQTWGNNLQWSTLGAYPGDGPNGYAWTANYGATPSASIIIPLPSGLPAGPHAYDIYEWIPSVLSVSWNLLYIAANGTTNNPQLGIPWSGTNGSNLQYLQIPQNNQGAWVKLGPGPHSDPSLDGGCSVWMNPSTGLGYPYLQIHYLGFLSGEESFDAFRVVQIDVVPEPSTIALGLLGGFALFVCRPRTSFIHQVNL